MPLPTQASAAVPTCSHLDHQCQTTISDLPRDGSDPTSNTFCSDPRALSQSGSCWQRDYFFLSFFLPFLFSLSSSLLPLSESLFSDAVVVSFKWFSFKGKKVLRDHCCKDVSCVGQTAVHYWLLLLENLTNLTGTFTVVMESVIVIVVDIIWEEELLRSLILSLVLVILLLLWLKHRSLSLSLLGLIS